MSSNTDLPNKEGLGVSARKRQHEEDTHSSMMENGKEVASEGIKNHNHSTGPLLSENFELKGKGSCEYPGGGEEGATNNHR